MIRLQENERIDVDCGDGLYLTIECHNNRLYLNHQGELVLLSSLWTSWDTEQIKEKIKKKD